MELISHIPTLSRFGHWTQSTTHFTRLCPQCKCISLTDKKGNGSSVNCLGGGNVLSVGTESAQGRAKAITVCDHFDERM